MIVIAYQSILSIHLLQSQLSHRCSLFYTLFRDVANFGDFKRADEGGLLQHLYVMKPAWIGGGQTKHNEARKWIDVESTQK